MSIIRRDSQQTTCNATAVINGERRQVATASCRITPENSMYFSIDLMDDWESLGDYDRSEVMAMFTDYLVNELAKCNANGLPIIPLEGK